MKRLKLAVAAGLGLMTAIGGLSLVPTSVRAEEGFGATCANTYCLPGGTTCREQLNWTCSLSGGCAGSTRCGVT